MKRPNDQLAVKAASQPYLGTCGESIEATRCQFLPAFIDREDGRVELARMVDGRLAPMHLICHLPVEWALQCDAQGHVIELKETIEAGFVREGRYFTRAQAAAAKPASESARG